MLIGEAIKAGIADSEFFDLSVDSYKFRGLIDRLKGKRESVKRTTVPTHTKNLNKKERMRSPLIMILIGYTRTIFFISKSLIQYVLESASRKSNCFNDG